MPSFLEGALAKQLYAGFKGKMLKGVLRRLGVAESGGLDGRGDPVPATPQTWTCEGFTDEYSAGAKAIAGIPDTDLKLCIFGASLPAGVEPMQGDQCKITKNGVATWYQVRKPGTDPADGLWVCQAFVIRTPEGA